MNNKKVVTAIGLTAIIILLFLGISTSKKDIKLTNTIKLGNDLIVSEKIVEAEEIKIDDRVIRFKYKDENINETLIIKASNGVYGGWNKSSVEFAITNIGITENVFIHILTQDNSIGIREAYIYDERVPYQEEVLMRENKISYCDKPFTKSKAVRESPNVYLCNKIEYICDVVGVANPDEDDKAYCLQFDGITKTEVVTFYEPGWVKINLIGVLDRKIIINKKFDDNKFDNTNGFITKIESNETKYFKIVIDFSPKQKKEFLIEAVGDKDGYGLLR